MSTPAIAVAPPDTPPTPPDIQPRVNKGCTGPSPGSSHAGRRGGEPLWGEGKPRVVGALADEQGLDLERSLAYSNGDEDGPFLDTVGNPVAVWPNRGLRAGAQRGGWPVLWCERRLATRGPLELAGTAVFYGWTFAGTGAGLGVGLLRHSRREQIDIGGEVGAERGLAAAGSMS